MLDFFLEPFRYPFFQNAFLVLLLLGLVMGVIGALVVLRELAFFTHSISHAVFPGIVIAYWLSISYLVGALAIGIVVGIAIGLSSSPGKGHSHNTTTAVIYSAMFALGIVLVSWTNTTRQLSELLFGRLFASNAGDVWMIGVSGALLLAVIGLLRKELLFVSFDRQMASATGLPVLRLDVLFYVLIAIATIIVMPAVGNILALALLTAPAATARLLTNRLVPLILWSIGLNWLIGFSGIYLAYYLNFPAGATVVALMCAVFLLVFSLRKVFEIFNTSRKLQTNYDETPQSFSP
jgi:ABC-type Mn2+/Zn2+ transport system permease subunit